jgi:hypothetical protein
VATLLNRDFATGSLISLQFNCTNPFLFVFGKGQIISEGNCGALNFPNNSEKFERFLP